MREREREREKKRAVAIPPLSDVGLCFEALYDLYEENIIRIHSDIQADLN